VKPYGGHLPRIYTCCSRHDASRIDRTAEYRSSKRRERFRAANDIASQDAVDRLDDFDLEIPCCDSDCVACYGIDVLDALDAFPLPPLTAPLVALALEAA